MSERESKNGFIYKSAKIDVQEFNDDELNAINKFSLAPLTAEEVFVFKIVVCDNEVDRDFECFSIQALKQLEDLLIGKTVIKNHSMNADDQIARIYSTELLQNSEITTSGEPYTQLVAKVYMCKTDENASIISDIRAGIKKEVSVCCSVNSAICSICKNDRNKCRCRHLAGKEYADVENGKLCYFILNEVADAYEVSFVAVPAQKNAGTYKAYDANAIFEENQNKLKDLKLEIQLGVAESFIFLKNKRSQGGI